MQKALLDSPEELLDFASVIESVPDEESAWADRDWSTPGAHFPGAEGTDYK